MEAKFNLKGAGRKKLALAVSELLEKPLNYKGAPTFAYESGSYSIDKEGTLNGPDDWGLIADLSGLYSLMPEEKTYDVEPAAFIDDAPPIVSFGGGTHPNYDCDYNAEGPQASDCDERDVLTIEMPLEGFTEESFANLEKLVASKTALIMKAIDTESLSIIRKGSVLQFPWFPLPINGEEATAYSQLVTGLCSIARTQKRVTSKEKLVENEKFAFRVFLIRLGFIGDEYKATRKILLKNLSGNSAFRDGTPRVEVSADE